MYPIKCTHQECIKRFELSLSTLGILYMQCSAWLRRCPGNKWPTDACILSPSMSGPQRNFCMSVHPSWNICVVLIQYYACASQSIYIGTYFTWHRWDYWHYIQYVCPLTVLRLFDALSLCILFLPSLQAKSLGHGITGALYLINPVSLFKFDAVSKISHKRKVL